MNSLKGFATGIGSLPHQDTEQAIDLIFKYIPYMPFWPQLPKLNPFERMIPQFSENIPLKEEDLELFYEKVITKDLDYFKITPDYAAGLYAFIQRLENGGPGGIEAIKIQTTGPFTFAAGTKDVNDVALLHNKVFFQAILKGLSLKALWQISLFKKFNKQLAIFIDEPFLGSFGSAYTPINREDVVLGLNDFTEELKSENVLIGVHCCGNTDWSIFTDIKNIDIINFDAFDFQEKFVLYANDLNKFLKKGGIICWGIVPTQEFTGQENVELLVRKIHEGIEALTKKGIDPELLKENLLISPACGLGTFTPQKAESIFALLSETSNFIQKNF